MRVDQLWRYPIKSMGGEPLTSTMVDAGGIIGDRRIGVLDKKDEFTWAGAVPPLMRLQASTVGDGVAEVLLPDGSRVRSDDPGADALISAVVEADVRLAPHPPHQSFGAVHLISTTSLATLAAALPDSVIDRSRFRPNIVLTDVPGDGYPEHDWVGRTMLIGSARLTFTMGCERCVMITKETPAAPHDREVLRWVARELSNTLGVYAAIEVPGHVSVGDEAHWIDDTRPGSAPSRR